MANRTLEVTDGLHDYILRHIREPKLLAELREETSRHPLANMQISPEQGQFLSFLVAATGVRRAIEVGTFTGYSALCVALALPADGKLIACDISEEYTTIARRYWAKAGMADRIDLRLAPAVETLDRLLEEGQSGSFDFGFIDADKSSYDSYYERVLALLRPGGVLVVDNVLWGGDVADPEKKDADTISIRALNKKIVSDSRVSMSLIPVADGLMLVRKNP